MSLPCCMSKQNSLIRYNLIVKKLSRCPSTFEEINYLLENESQIQGLELSVSKRTFQRDVKDIRDLFDIDIVYSRQDKTYCINEHESSDVNNRILESFQVYNALPVSDRIAQSIHSEQRKSLGAENLFGFVHTIECHRIVRYTYQSLFKEEPEQRSIKPYSLKEYRGRWYLLGTNTHDDVMNSFALDRFADLEILLQTSFPVEGFDINAYYEHCFGIVGPQLGTKSHEVVLRFFSHQGKYIKSLPLHHSQTVVEDTASQLTVKLKVHLTKDFVMELLSHANDVKVIAPQEFQDEMKQILQQTAGQYEA